jgi:hypothetical protein
MNCGCLTGIYDPDSVFFVWCEQRLEKQLRTVLFCVTVQHVVVISYQYFGTMDWSHHVFWILES